MSTADPELEVTLRRVEAQEARARHRMLGVTAVLIVLGIALLAVIGRSIIASRREVTAKGEQLSKANKELALYTEPMTKLRGDLAQLTTVRDEKWDRLKASEEEAENVQSQLGQSDEEYARNLAATEDRAQSFNRELEATIANINHRLEELRRSGDETVPENSLEGRQPRRDLRGSREEAAARGTLIKALTTQRQMLEDALNQSRRYQSTMAELRKRVNSALAASRQAHAELRTADLRIGEVCRVAAGKDAAGR